MSHIVTKYPTTEYCFPSRASTNTDRQLSAVFILKHEISTKRWAFRNA